MRVLKILLLAMFAGSCAGQQPSPASLGNVLRAPEQERKDLEDATRELRQMVERADAVTYIRYPRPCFACRELTPEWETVVRGSSRVLGGLLATEVRGALLRPDAFTTQRTDPCVPLAPSAALVFQRSGGVGALFLYEDCNAVKVVTPQLGYRPFIDFPALPWLMERVHQ